MDVLEKDSSASCPVCGLDKKTSLAFERNSDAVYACRGCGVEFLHPQPADETLKSIYSSEYFLGAEDEVSSEKVAALKRATANLYLNAIAPFVNAKDSRLLELGCGSGDFLVEAKLRGFQVEGLEYSTHATEVANARLGSHVVRAGSLETTLLSPNAYDLIAAFDVIEHVRDPAYSLNRVYSGLKSGGAAAIVTPSLDSWSRRLLGRHWMEYKTEHLTYFSRKSLARLLKDAGFDSILFLPNYKVLSFDYIARHFDRFPVALISPALALVRRITPLGLAHREVKVVASGMMAIARKGS